MRSGFLRKATNSDQKRLHVLSVSGVTYVLNSCIPITKRNLWTHMVDIIRRLPSLYPLYFLSTTTYRIFIYRGIYFTMYIYFLSVRVIVIKS